MRIGAPVVDLVGVVATIARSAPPSAADACPAGSAWPCRSVGAPFVTSAKNRQPRRGNGERRSAGATTASTNAAVPTTAREPLGSRGLVAVVEAISVVVVTVPPVPGLRARTGHRDRSRLRPEPGYPGARGRDIRPRRRRLAARAGGQPARYTGFSGWTGDAAATARSPSVTPADGRVVAIGTPPATDDDPPAVRTLSFERGTETLGLRSSSPPAEPGMGGLAQRFVDRWFASWLPRDGRAGRPSLLGSGDHEVLRRRVPPHRPGRVRPTRVIKLNTPQRRRCAPTTTGRSSPVHSGG